jgi:hypothetical protein
MSVTLVLAAVLAFEIKHFFCDFALQTGWMISKKGKYFHPGGLVHAFLHLLGSIPALLILTRNPQIVICLLIAEFIVHYHADFLKARVDHRLRLPTDSNGYWIIFGLDQLIHQVTYLTMTYLAVNWPF